MQRPDRLGGGSLDRIGDAEQPGGLAVDRRRTSTVWPSRAELVGRAAERAASCTRVGQQLAGCRQRRCGPSTRPSTPLPVTDRKSVDVERQRFPAPLRRDDRRGQRVLARRSRLAARRRSSLVGRTPGCGPRSTSRGLPSVSVPVLSTTSVSTFSSTSSASAFRISTPACAPRPVPTMIDIGVARPSAHGQAMISTATAFTSACAQRGSGRQTAQTMKVRTATSNDDRARTSRRPRRRAAESARASAAPR